MAAGQIDVPAESPYTGQPVGATRARTRTGASIVAVVRGEDVIASPVPTEVIRSGDVLVVIGTHEGIDGVRRIIAG
ncbi:cation:proton antiporter regulatory subunit [Actinosynnema sp. CS-041913]|uniref:cation:proton antiporter regulatory subunit n=1 Tax=Actinosynnema sp. CS-041913 TaxID=3239917 RepID=UPI003D8A34E3